MKAGTKIIVTYIRPEGDAAESAVVIHPTKKMGAPPTGYVPVRFARDGAVMLVSAGRITAA
jgi:hypothetical protein